jgi:hypothetical protein
VGAGASCSDDDHGADQCGDRVKPLSEHDRDLADEDVAEDAATDARDRAEDGLVLDYDGAAAWYRPVVRMRHR